MPIDLDTDAFVNTTHSPYDTVDDFPIYWHSFYVRNPEYAIIMTETQHVAKLDVARDPNVPRSFNHAMRLPRWCIAIDIELSKFEKNLCFKLVRYNGQSLIPLMWLFNIKTDGTYKARLVGRGDLMVPHRDFDPNAVYCGNVSACSIRIAITIAAAYGLIMRGGDLEGAYLVTQANPDFPVHVKTPQGYTIPPGYCIQAIGNLYGFPPAGYNFSERFDAIVRSCGYLNTPYDLKLFHKWIDGRPILLIAHSDDFRWFGSEQDLSEWTRLVNAFEESKYKVTDASDKEFVGIRITRDADGTYYMDQSRMIDQILEDHDMKNCPLQYLPYPLTGPALSKADNSTPDTAAECAKFPYRKVIGQLMYGMVHTLVTIIYALNLLSRYGNNPGPRHILFAKHLLAYVKTTSNPRCSAQSV
jgi:hypothetical protein